MQTDTTVTARERAARAAERRFQSTGAAAGAWPDAPETDEERRAALVHRIVLGLLASVMLFLYLPIAAATLADCWRDENYSHGVLIPLVILALLRQRHHDVVRLGAPAAARMRALAWACLAAGGALFVLGAAAAEWFTLRASGVLLVLGLAGVLGGPERLRRYGPPLALLICAVPLPYVLFYKLSFPLQLLSARLASDTLSFMGLDVTRSGNIFEVNGQALEVVGACSGIRSMMTLCTVALVVGVASRLGVLRSTTVACAALPVAMCGNLLRLVATALLVVWIGPRGAQGALHEAIGMLSFLASVALLGLVVRWVSRSRRPVRPGATVSSASVRSVGWWKVPTLGRIAAWLRTLRVVSPRAAWTALLVVALAGGYGSLLRAHAARPSGTPNLAALPMQIGSLSGEDVPLDDRVLDKLRPEDYVFRSYANGVAPATGLYVAYYRDPREGAQIHSPLHCYPGAGWRVLQSDALQVRDLQGQPTRMQRLLVSKGTRRDVVVYWYDTRTGRLTSDLDLKLNLMRTALLHRPQDAAFVRWSTPIDQGENIDGATERLLGTVAHAYPHLAAALPFGG